MAKSKILIIDDEKAVKDAIKKALKGEGYQFVLADNGKDGVEMIKKEKPDLVFLDLKMPVLDGLGVLKKIKIAHDDPYAVVVITAHAEDDDIEECYTLGVTNFLRKTLNLTEVRAVASRCLDAKKIEAELRAYREDLESVVYEQTREIKEQLDFQQTMMNSIPAPIYIKDLNGDFIGCNNAFAQAVGIHKDDVVGKTYVDFFNKTLAKRDSDKDRALLKSGLPQVYHGKLPFADGGRKDVSFYKAVFKGKDGKTAGIIGTIFDVSDREKAIKKGGEKAEALKQANMSLRILIKQLSDAQEEDRGAGVPGLKELILPNKEQLEAILSSPTERAYIDNIMLNLNRVTSNFAKKLSQKRLGLSPKEIQVADLIRIGLNNKEAALQMNVTKSTIEFHRDNLRRKLGLKHEKRNLRAFLMALDADMAAEEEDYI